MNLQNLPHVAVSKGLLIGFGFLIAVLVLSAVISLWLTQQADDDLDRLAQVQVPLEKSVTQMRISAAETVQGMLAYSQDRDPAIINRIDGYEIEFEVAADEFISLTETDELNQLGIQVGEMHDEFSRSRYEIVSLIDQLDIELESFLEDVKEVGDLVESKLRVPIDANDLDAETKLEAAFGLELSLLEISTSMESYAAQPAIAMSQTVQGAKADFRDFVMMFKGTSLSVLEESWISEIDSDFDDIISNGDDIVALADNLDLIVTDYEQDLGKIITVLDDQIQPLIDYELVATADDTNNALEAATVWSLVLGILGLVIGGSLAWIISRRIARSLEGLKKGARRIADGKLDHRFYIDTKDEFSEIGLALNQMLENIGRSREALGESEETAWQLLDATTDSVILMDLRGIIHASNEIAAERFEKSLEQMIDTSYYDLLPADLVPSRKAQIAEVIKTVKPFHFEDDREGMVLDSRIFPVINPENGRVSRIAIFARDITTRKWVEDVTESLGRRNELILEAAGEGIYGLDTQGRTTFVNPAAARMLGYKPGDLIGQYHHELVHHSKLSGMPYPSDQCPIHAAFRDGIARRNVDDEVFWRKDRTSFPVEYTSTPILEDGKVAGAVVTFRDITERKHMEIALRRSEERYRSMFESPATLIISVDSEGIIIDCNPRVQRMIGYLPGEMVGQNLIDFVDSDYRVAIQHVLEEVVAKGFQYDKRYKMRRKDGTSVDVNMNAASVKDEYGEYIRTICMIETVPQQVQT